MEIWKDIKGFEGLYQVSNFGRVKRLAHAVKTIKGQRNLGEQIKKQSVRKDGYMCVSIRKEGERFGFLVARLVAIHFIENPEGKSEVNHISGDKSDNNVANLEWTTRKENAQHAMRTGLMPTGEGHGMSKLKEFEVKEMRELYSMGNVSTGELGKKYNVSYKNVWLIVTNRAWNHV